jgi:hypothetical protein
VSSAGLICGLYCLATIATMAAVMLYRRSEYSATTLPNARHTAGV